MSDPYIKVIQRNNQPKNQFREKERKCVYIFIEKERTHLPKPVYQNSINQKTHFATEGCTFIPETSRNLVKWPRNRDKERERATEGETKREREREAEKKRKKTPFRH